MGDVADMLEQLHYQDDYWWDEKDDIYWTQKNGDKILLKDMSTSHINNCINLLKRSGEDNDWINTFEKEINFRKRKSLNTKLKKIKNYEEEKEEIDLDLFNENIFTK